MVDGLGFGLITALIVVLALAAYLSVKEASERQRKEERIRELELVVKELTDASSTDVAKSVKDKGQ